MGDPIEYKIWGYELTLRKDDAKCIDIELQENKEKKKESSDVKYNSTEHPHIGESGIYHVKQRGEKIDNIVQSADWLKSACGKFPRGNG